MKTLFPILAFLVALAGCDGEEHANREREIKRDHDAHSTITYKCSHGYMRTLAQKVYEQTSDPFDAPPSGSVTWNPSPKLILQKLGFPEDEEFVYYFNYDDSTFLLKADGAGHAAFLALHEKLGIAIHPKAEQDVEANL